MGKASGQAVDVEIWSKHILRIKERLNKILSRHTGQSVARIEKDADRDYYMTAEEAKEYGIIDTIIDKR